MTAAESYHDLAQIFSYPWQKGPLESSVARLRDRGVELDALASFLAASPLGAVQEEFVAAFDFDPRCAPYAGHHLYGEHRLRAEYLIRLKEVYRGHGFQAASAEPPDHLATMFLFAAHLAREDGEGAAALFVEEYLAEGVRRFREATEGQQRFTWREAVVAAFSVCAADREEVG